MAKPASEIATMRSIAERAGVSTMTVSRVLNKHPKVASATRERVMRICEEVGYRPNPLLTALVEQRRSMKHQERGTVLAYVIDQDYTIENSYYTSRLYNGAKDRARELGFKLEVFTVERTLEAERRWDTVLYNRGIPGLILAPMPLNILARTYDFDWDRYAAVALDYGFEGVPLDRIMSDHYEAMYRVMTECKTRMIHRVGLVLGNVFNHRVKHRVQAAYMAESAQDYIPPLELDTWDEAAFSAWFELNQPKTLVTSMLYLTEICRLLKKRGMRIPEDMGVINLNTSPPLTLPHYGSKRMTGMDPMAYEMGSASVDRLATQLFHNQRGLTALQTATLIPPQWVEGDTLLNSH